MLLGPIFSLELVTCARRGRYYLLRILYALVLLFTLAVTYQTSQVRQPFAGIHGVANVARDFFEAFGVLQVLAILLLGPAMVAGTIAQERERRTIEYLFTSQLSNADIVLGKLAARLLNMAFLLTAGIPVLALAMLLGGIPPAAMLGVSLLTLETLVAVGSLSIAVSVGRRRTRDAVISAYLLLAALLILPVLGFQLRYAQPGGFWATLAQWLAGASEPVLKLNPFAVLAEMNVRPPSGESLAMRLMKIFAGYAGFSAACLALAVGTVRRSYASSEGRGAGRRRLAWPAWRPPVWNRALVWKEMFVEPALGRLGWIGRIALAVLLAALFLGWLAALDNGLTKSYQRRSFVQWTTMLVCCLECFGLLMAAARAATSVTSEKERDCWVTLLSTPLSAAEILGGKLWGNLYAIRWVAAGVLFFWTGTAVIEPEFAPAIPVQLATWALLLVYASCLGIGFSLWCRSSLRSMAATLGLALFAGGLYLPFILLILEFLLTPWGNQGVEWIVMIPCVPFLLAYPAVFWDGYLAGQPFDRTGMSVVTYVMGLIVYGCFAALLWPALLGRFNQWVGRMTTDVRPWAGPTSRTHESEP
ncbi:MAG TPA: ABC transporter permease subunit [Pirellulales bacterium]|jgi:ABC-type transport system involved in multi-copper enzyme maturation permease subunit|nr:ABC transporter permease subunit [Pirellulales bacterium]